MVVFQCDVTFILARVMRNKLDVTKVHDNAHFLRVMNCGRTYIPLWQALPLEVRCEDIKPIVKMF